MNPILTGEEVRNSSLDLLGEINGEVKEASYGVTKRTQWNFVNLEGDGGQRITTSLGGLVKRNEKELIEAKVVTHDKKADTYEFADASSLIGFIARTTGDEYKSVFLTTPKK